MQTKQFSGATIDEVLAQVRAELGEEAVILQTKRVVKGGIGGFFGREGIEVTAAAGLAAAESEAANREAAASVATPAPAPAPPAPEAPAPEAQAQAQAGGDDPAPAPDPAPPAPPLASPFQRHLEGRLEAAQEAEDDPAMAHPGPAASPAAAYARASGAPARPFAPGDAERAQAIIAAARSAVRDAHDAVPASHAAPAPEPADEAEPFVAAPVAARPRARATAPARQSRGSLEAVRAELLRAGVDERYLDPFLEGFSRSSAPFLEPADSLRDAVKDHVAARLPTVRDWKPRAAGHTVAFVGQSGVGKTSAAVKLAGRYRAAGLAVAIVAAGPGPHDALEGHARRLDVQIFRAADGAALAEVVATLADRDLVVIDTDGRSHQDLAEIEELARLLAPAKPDEVHLVLPAATPLADLGDVQRRFRMVGVNRLTVTKIDETRHLGNLINIPLRMGKPLAYLADGTAVPGALAPADARRVAELLLS